MARTIEGVGLGLRWEFLDDVLDRLDRNERIGDVAFFEVSPENYMRRGGYIPRALERVASAYPIATHGLTMSVGGVDPFDAAYFGELAQFLARFEPSFHSDHLCFCGTSGRLLHELLPIPFTPTSARHAAARIREAQDRLGRRMAIENVTHYVVPGRQLVDEAAFLSDVIEQSGCDLLLDVNNVHVNASNYGFDAQRFIAALPLERVVEIHIAGHEDMPEHSLVVDTHGAPVAPPVFELLRWTLRKTGPVPVLLERDNRVPALGVLLDEVAALRAIYRDATQVDAHLAHGAIDG